MDARPSNGMMKTFKYNSSISQQQQQQQQPLFTTMDYRSSFTQNNSSNLRDASFSSYLRPKECSVDECELSIFDAQKYFNESIHDTKYSNNKALSSSSSAVNAVDHAEKRYDPPPPLTPPSVSVPRLSSVSSSTDGYSRNYRVRSFNATPTASSEASWNSQTGLLSNPPGSIAVSLRDVPNSHHPHRNHQERKRRGPPTQTTKWFFGRTCPCYGKKSVQVQDQDVLPVPPLGSKRHIPKSDKRMADTNSHQKSSVTTTKNELDLEEETQEVIPNSHRSTQISNPKFQVPEEKLVVIPNSHRSTQISNPKFQVPEEKLVVIPNSKSQTCSSVTKEEKVVVIPMNSNSHRLISSSELPNFASSNIVHHQRERVRPHGDVSASAAGFSFPILNPLCPAKNTSSRIDDPPRESLEIFQPSDDQSVSRKSIMASNRRFSGSPISRAEDDVASDASSDLFEIESFSTQTTSYPMYHRRDSLDEAPTFNARRSATLYGGGRRSLDDEPMTPSVVATECYEPSEASIDWSVTTAEGFDRGSVTNFSISASEIDYVDRRGWDKGGGGGVVCNGGSGGGGGMEEGFKRRGNGLLLSCRHEKAVSVGPNPVKCVQEKEELPGGPPYPLISTFRHVSSRPPQPNHHPNSARLSLGFAA